VEIVHENWPDTIKPYRVPGAVAVSVNPSSTEIKRLRSAHLNSALQMDDGTVYLPIGGGMASDGTGLAVTLVSNQMTKRIKVLERWVKENPGEILTELRKNGYRDGAPLELKLQSDDRGFWAFSPTYSTRFLLSTEWQSPSIA